MSRREHFTQPHSQRRLARALLLAGLLATSQAYAAKPGSDFYEDALKRFDAKDISGAIVQLKNALQLDPRLLPAQVLLADAYLIAGSPATAETALEAAAKLGADRAVIVPKLAQALISQFKYQALLDRINGQGLPPLVAAEVMTYRAAAYMGIGNLKAAEGTLREADRLDPDSASIKVAQGTLMLRQNNVPGARALAERAVVMAPGNASAWNLKASVAHVARQHEAALSSYTKAIDLDPQHIDARLGRAGLLFDLNRPSAAEADLKAMRNFAAGDPRAAYLLALDAARKGNNEAARAALSEATGVLDQLPPELIKGNAQLLMLGGLANYGLKQPAKARGYLQSYIALEPNQAGARKLLASILLDERDYNRVIELLYPFADTASADAQTLSLLAAAYMGKKKFQQASELFEQVARLSPTATDAAVGLGMSQLGQGRIDQGMAQLQAAFDQDANQSRAGMVLASTYLSRGDAPRAVAIARRIVAKEPDNLSALNLLGVALSAIKDASGARASFSQAARLQRNFLPAQLNLVRLDIAEGKAEAARKRLDAVLKVSIDHPEALLELARLEQMQKRPAEAIRALQRVRTGQAKAQAIGPLLYLVELHLQAGDAQSALEVALELEAVHPENLSVLAAVGQSHQAGGNLDKARLGFNRMARLVNDDSTALVRIAQLLMGIRAFDDASLVLKKALTYRPGHLPAEFMMVELDLQAGRLDSAAKRAAALRTAHPGLPATARLLGMVYMAQKKPLAAIREFKLALSKERSGANTLALFQAYVEAGDSQSATELMHAWLRDHPNDTAAEVALAEAYLRSGQWQQARTAYLAVTKKRPQDVGVLNNLANVMLKLNDPEALGYARRAHALAAGDPNVADTLGWILVRNGQAQQALPYLRDARLRAASNRVIQYHLGVALHQLGRKAEAKRELQSALSGPGSFDGIEEARALLRQL